MTTTPSRAAPASAAAGLFAIILMFGPVSGGHFNPVVSFVDAAFAGISRHAALAYLPAQLGGCIVCAILANTMFAKAAVSISAHPRASPAHLLDEIAATSGLLLVIFALARARRGASVHAAVAAYIGAAYWFTNSTSFAKNASPQMPLAASDPFARDDRQAMRVAAGPGPAPAASPGQMEAFELPVLSVIPAAASPSREWLRMARLARTLAWASLVWLTIEGTVGVIAGLVAGSIALVGYGLDSAIEGIASVIVVWRFTGSRTLSEHSERRAQQWVAVSFFLLTPYVAIESLNSLLAEHHAETSIVGIVLTAGTLAICPGLGIAKQKIGDRLGSLATKGEGKQNLLCAGLAAGVLVGLLANTTLGIWWLDPAVGLIIAAACVLAGCQSWRGDGCACTECAIPEVRLPS